MRSRKKEINSLRFLCKIMTGFDAKAGLSCFEMLVKLAGLHAVVCQYFAAHLIVSYEVVFQDTGSFEK
ncbi:UNVERIFIED_CONTAM: hypothetical protein FKN15_075851 [Acipenser sinensis]